MSGRTDSDLISREAAIDALDKIFPADPMRNDYTQGIACGAALAKTYVEQLPSAQPERKTGRWLFPFGDKKYKKCSSCGRTYYSIPHDSNYCPNCGAKMEVDE